MGEELNGMIKNSSYSRKPIIKVSNLITANLNTVVKYPADKERTITFIFDKKEMLKPWIQLGYVSSQQIAKDGDSIQLLGYIGLEAIKLGANTVLLVNEGVERTLKASGWGIGLNYTQANMGIQDDTGRVGSGGTGYSTGWSKYLDKPWIRAIAVYVQDEYFVKK